MQEAKNGVLQEVSPCNVLLFASCTKLTLQRRVAVTRMAIGLKMMHLLDLSAVPHHTGKTSCQILNRKISQKNLVLVELKTKVSGE
jgi:hypothetical protein